MSAVEELRSAAVLLRQRATAATPGPWRYDPDMLDNGAILSNAPEVNPGWGCLVSEESSTRGEDSTWMATVDPLVGVALAELLDVLSWFPSQADPTDLTAAGRLARLILAGGGS